MEEIKVKICGLYREADIQAVNEALPDYAGFIIGFPKSHRNVSLEQVAKFRKLLDKQIQAVGVFVDASVADMVAASQYLDVIQLHGSETNGEIEHLRRKLPEKEIWKAIKVRGIRDLEAAVDSIADRVVLDNGYGTGETFDWSLLRHLQHAEKSFLLAGGLKADNLVEAMEGIGPYGLDISSGVETEKRKDREKIQEVVRIVREFRHEEEGEDEDE